jgi:glycosyltransferase involved in cell wall biosynthesis
MSEPPLTMRGPSGTTPPKEASAPELLLITTRKLSESAGEWRLIANRSAVLESKFGIRTDIIYLRPQVSAPARLDGSKWFGDVRSIGLGNRLGPGSALLDLRRSARSWLSGNPRGYIVVSGAQLYFTPLGVPKERVIIDLHGTLDEWIEGEGNGWRDRLLRFAHPFAAIAEKRALDGAGGAFVVSRSLAEYARDSGVSKVWKIPCGLPESCIVERADLMREKWRQRFSITKDTTVFAYSGGLSKWQCVREAIQLFGRVRPFWPGNCHLVIMTPRLEGLDGAIAGLDASGVTAFSLPAEDVGAALCACDIGLLIREDNSTNHNAFPNKFAEYLAAGLFVITSPGLKDPSELVLRRQLGMLFDPSEIRQGLTARRTGDLTDAYRARGSQLQFVARARAAVLEELSMERLLAPFAESVTGK